METLRVKSELEEGDITIEYNNITRNQISLLKTPKIEAKTNNKGNLNDLQTEFNKSSLKVFDSNSCKKLPASSCMRPDENQPFSGTKFLHSQVHSNPVLQSLLKDIISLNNEKDVVDEDAINQEIATLRSKNNLPSLNAEVSIILEDSDYSEGSEGEVCSYSKDSKNYGKDSGYDNESQYSESIDEDNKSEVHNNLSFEAKRSLVIAEPEYIDLDNYFGTKRKITDIKDSLLDRTNSQPANKSTCSFNGLICPICNKALKTKRSYRRHTKNGTGCVCRRLINCKGNCKFFGTKDEYLKHKQDKHFGKRLKPNKTRRKHNAVFDTPFICQKCEIPFISFVALQQHNQIHKEKMSCLFCDFMCKDLTKYNLHISSKHSHRVQKESFSSDSDSLQIVEINDV